MFTPLNIMPQFGNQVPNFADSIVPVSQPPDALPLPSQSGALSDRPISAGRYSMKTSMNPCFATLKTLPFVSGFEQNLTIGCPVFVNNKRGTNGNTDGVIVASPAMINYLMEDEARKLARLPTIKNIEAKNMLLKDIERSHHMNVQMNAEIFAQKYNFFGVIDNIDGKDTSRSSSNNVLYLNTVVSGATQIANFWGDVSDGDRIAWTIGMKRKTNEYFINSNGRQINTSKETPDRYLQLIPINLGKNRSRPSHNRNYDDLDSPLNDDIDYVAPVELLQKDVEINLRKRDFTFSQDSYDGVSKPKKIRYNDYHYGHFIPVGIVRKGVKGKRPPTQSDITEALRDDRKISDLGQISVYLDW